LTVLAYAKVNLGLYVDRLRPDGYHEIETIMTTVGISDSVTLREIPAGVEVSVSPSLGIAEADNLAYRAGSRMKGLAAESRGIGIRIIKRIPVAAGLAGGSADAAATIVGINRLWNMGLTDQAMEEVAAEIGSDVPFLIRGGLTVATSRGEVLRRIDCGCEINMVLVCPRTEVRSDWAYRHARRGLTLSRERIRLLESALTGGNVNEIGANLTNDLEPGVSGRCSMVLEAKARLSESGALGCVMSGSGPSVIGIFEREEDAHKTASEISSGEWDVFVTKPVLPGMA
jgi:4-diphosphocytidyl-2-C-methyl-D-erythritol kinase